MRCVTCGAESDDYERADCWVARTDIASVRQAADSCLVALFIAVVIAVLLVTAGAAL